LGSTELCNARGIRGSRGGNVSIERRRRDTEVTDAGIGEPCLGGLNVVPTETPRLVLGSKHNEGMSRHSDLMIARARLRWLGEVRQMPAIGTPPTDRSPSGVSDHWFSVDAARCVLPDSARLHWPRRKVIFRRLPSFRFQGLSAERPVDAIYNLGFWAR